MGCVGAIGEPDTSRVSRNKWYEWHKRYEWYLWVGLKFKFKGWWGGCGGLVVGVCEGVGNVRLRGGWGGLFWGIWESPRWVGCVVLVVGSPFVPLLSPL